MDFWITILISAFIASIAATGLFMQIQSGQLNVGMAPFMGVGGYMSGALCIHLGMAPFLSIPVAVLVGFLCGALFSALTLRLHHWFFAVTTLTFSVAAVSGVGMIRLFGGPTGLINIPLINSSLLAVVALVGTVSIAYAIQRSSIGLAIRATGDDELLSEIFGVRVKLLRIMVFGIGSAMAALAGALYAHRFGIYQPSDLGFHQSLLLFVYVIVGGKRSVFGPLVGTFFLFIIPEFIKVAPEAELIVFGALMLLVATLMPDGLVGAANAGYVRLRARTAGLGRESGAPQQKPVA